MKKHRFMTVILGGLCALMLLAAGGSRAMAQEALVTFKVLSPEIALKAAQSALAVCRSEGYQVTVAVVDRFGVTQVVLRDRFAGPHTPSTATRKAWTAVSFRTSSLEMDEVARNSGGIRHIDDALMLGGGVPIEAAGSIVGGIGVSGAPSPQIDDDCARVGIASIDDAINF